MFGNDQEVIIQSSGYNGSEPTRICPNCGIEKPLSDFGYRNMGGVLLECSRGVKSVDSV